jgi:hypothetical protein
MGPKAFERWPFTRVPEWYTSSEAKVMNSTECSAAASTKINAEAKIGVDTVCLLYNWAEDGMLSLSWLKETYPGVHEQVLEWKSIAEREYAVKRAVYEGRLRLIPVPESDWPSAKRARTEALSSASSSVATGVHGSASHSADASTPLDAVENDSETSKEPQAI